MTNQKNRMNKFNTLVEPGREWRVASIGVQENVSHEDASLLNAFIESMVLVQYNTGQIELNQVLEEINEMTEFVTVDVATRIKEVTSLVPDYVS